MEERIKINDQEFTLDEISDHGKKQVAGLQFSSTRIEELNNMHALLQRAKVSYIESLRKEMISSKAGLLFEED